MSLEEDDRYKEDTWKDKFSHKLEESPFVVLGIIGVIGSCAYATYRYKTRGPALSTSIYLMQLRLYAQGMFAGLAALGVGTEVYKDYRRKQAEKEQQKALQR